MVDPIPDIEAPLVIVTHATLLTAVHAQLEPVVTAMLLLLPVDGTSTVVADRL